MYHNNQVKRIVNVDKLKPKEELFLVLELLTIALTTNQSYWRLV